jgi:RecA-family ATPase
MNIHTPDHPRFVLEPTTFTFQTASELFETPDEKIAYCVEDLLPFQGLSILAGKPKAGKSTLVRQLAIAVAQGKPFLGRQTVQSKVIYIALEEKRSEIKRHFQDLGLTGSDPVLIHCNVAPKDALKLLQTKVEAEKDVGLIIIDPLFKFTRFTDGNDYVTVSAALEHVLQLARVYGAHIMTVHHTKKKKSEDVMDDVLGSTALAGGVDTLMILDIDGQQRSVATIQRYGQNLPMTQLTFNQERREIALGITGEEAEALRSTKVKDEIENNILSFVKKHCGCTQENIFAAVSGRTTTKKSVFRDLVKLDVLSESGDGTKGSPFRYAIHGFIEA